MKPLSLFLLVCGIAVAADPQEWKGIGLISSNDRISQIHITNLLLSHDIVSGMEGSVVYGISVPPARAEQAIGLLRADARRLGYWIEFDRNDVVNAAGRRLLLSRASVSSVLEKPEYGSETALGRFLRSKELALLTTKYPYIISLSVHERQYLSTPKTFSTGYDVEIELQQSLAESSDGYRGSYQVYDGRVDFLGSSEWRHSGK